MNVMAYNIYDKLIHWLLNINQNIRDDEENTLKRVQPSSVKSILILVLLEVQFSNNTDKSNLLERRISLFYLCYEKDKVTLVTNKKHKFCNHEARLNVLHIVAKRNNESIQDFLKKSLALDRKFYCYTKNIHLTHISICLKLYLAKCNFLALVCSQKIYKKD